MTSPFTLEGKTALVLAEAAGGAVFLASRASGHVESVAPPVDGGGQAR